MHTQHEHALPLAPLQVNRHHVLDDCEDFSEEWIESKLGLVKK